MIARWAERLWAAPCSAVGLFLSLSFRRRYTTRGIVVAEGAAWPRLLGWRFRAITFGHVVLCVDELDPDTLDHELVHVDQYEKWGPFMFLLYPLASLAVMVRGGRPYKDNPFELAARNRPQK